MLFSHAESVGVSLPRVTRGVLSVCGKQAWSDVFLLLLELLLGPSIGWGLGLLSGPCVVLEH